MGRRSAFLLLLLSRLIQEAVKSLSRRRRWLQPNNSLIKEGHHLSSIILIILCFECAIIICRQCSDDWPPQWRAAHTIVAVAVEYVHHNSRGKRYPLSL